MPGGKRRNASPSQSLYPGKGSPTKNPGCEWVKQQIEVENLGDSPSSVKKRTVSKREPRGNTKRGRGKKLLTQGKLWRGVRAPIPADSFHGRGNGSADGLKKPMGGG